MAILRTAFFVLTCSFVQFGFAHAQDTEEVQPGEPVLTRQEVAEFLGSEGVKKFSDATMLAASPADAKRVAKRAIEVKNQLSLGAVDNAKSYDLILQVGHFPRTKGRTGGEGALVNEQQMAAYVAVLLYGYLKDQIHVALVPADNFGTNLKSKIFLALHTDSAPKTRRCALGPSVGYRPGSTSSQGMHMVAFALGTSLDLSIESFMRDSYTKGLSGYYAYKYVDTSLFEGVLEMSELTCEDQEINLLVNADRLAKNLSQAILWALREQN